ncbi:hypothetical protein GCM10010399_54980 [Dactylosporangium fulvum]|uniref:Uncharacterized protein n=1 Tax=Dactylosporangium fulvum TaxID=53359 RepID=A0ABY5W1Z5_9ACTN|nr:hypothetical protein [Dactylosporangium fulvum]UWP83131.1 hypothetical protein Dfulv_02140 [Dactylosporangium fulvum]
MTTIEEPKPRPELKLDTPEDDEGTTDDVRSLPAHMIRSYGILDSEFLGPSAFGPGSTSIGAILNVGAGPGRRRSVNQPLDGAFVRECVHTYAATATPDRLVERLTRRPVAYLSGPPGSGRVTAALVGLARMHAPDRIAQLHLVGDDPIHAYFSDPDLLRPGHGHIVELARTVEPESSELAQLSALARAAHASVVFVGSDAGNRQLVEYHVEHDRPDPSAVFLVRLERRLGDRGRCIGACPACEGECVRAYVERCRTKYMQYLSVNTMTDAVRFAADFAEHRPDGRAAVDLLADRAALRAKAVELLEAAQPQDGVGRDGLRVRRLSQHRRAARLAFAVFHGYPLTRVFEATGALIQRLNEAAGRPTTDRTVLEHKPSGAALAGLGRRRLPPDAGATQDPAGRHHWRPRTGRAVGAPLVRGRRSSSGLVCFEERTSRASPLLIGIDRLRNGSWLANAWLSGSLWSSTTSPLRGSNEPL